MGRGNSILTRLQHIRDFLLAPRKRALLNRRRLLREIEDRAVRPASSPAILILDPATGCNRNCPFCPTGNGSLLLKRELLRPEIFQAIVSHIRLEFLLEANLFNWGEPLLNRHLPEYIRFFSRRAIFTRIHTNFSVRDEEDYQLRELVESGLDELVVSIDGAGQESYGRYRVGGDFGRVTGNMKRLAAAKSRLGSTTPRVIYKMLLNRINEAEAAEAAELASALGADFHLDRGFEVPQDRQGEWVAASVAEKYGETPPTRMSAPTTRGIHTECRQMWDTLVVNADGSLFPCCLVADPPKAVGNLVDHHADDLWNNQAMVALRGYVLGLDENPLSTPNACQTCSHRQALFD